jgi:ABC-type polysaccharide/polyol phosphate transport system ATPase subunit
MSNNSVAIQLTNVSKTYVIHHEKPTLVETLGGKNRETFTALDNISLTIRKGERVGIIGTNEHTGPDKYHSIWNGKI